MRFDSIGVSIVGFYFTPQTPIFGEILAFYDAPKITFFGHIINFGSSVIYFYFSKVCGGGGLFTLRIRLNSNILPRCRLNS